MGTYDAFTEFILSGDKYRKITCSDQHGTGSYHFDWVSGSWELQKGNLLGSSSSDYWECDVMKWQVLCDMDGVVADFQNAAFAANGLPDPYTTPESMGCFDIEKLWGITAQEFWEPIDRLGVSFWANLPKMPEADQIIDLLDARVGIDNVAFLTAPHMSPYCIPGKYKWLEKNYPSLSKRVIFGSAKEFMAGPKRALVDDRDKNLDAFRQAGGAPILVPRVWNRGWQVKDEVMSRIEAQLDRHGVRN